MTTKQLEKRVAQLEQEVAELKKQQSVQPNEPKKGWRAWVGMATDDPFMKEVFQAAQQYREENRREARKADKRKSGKR